MNAPELDEEVMRKLYVFGALLAYRVSYFDPLRFEVVHLPLTFNESVAKAELDTKKSHGFTAGMAELFVRFDGAFARS